MRMPTSMLSKEKEKAEDEEPDFSLDLLDESQMIRLKRAFSIFDKDDSGSISSDEMLQVRAAPQRAWGSEACLPAPTCTDSPPLRAPAAGLPVTRQ